MCQSYSLSVTRNRVFTRFAVQMSVCLTKQREKIVENSGLSISLKENFRALGDLIGFTNYFFSGFDGGTEANMNLKYRI